MDSYATHQRLLTKYLMQTGGSILEFGCGSYSTPLIHEIGTAQGRPVLTIENDQAWIEKFRHFQTDLHRFVCVKDWDDWCPIGLYGLAFIDHAPALRRAIEIERLIGCVEVFVIHDTEDAGYDWKRILPQLEHLETDSTQPPWTTAARGLLRRQTESSKTLPIQADYWTGSLCIQNEVPWLVPAAIYKLDELCRPDDVVLEVGSGGSTLFFARRCYRVLSIETNPEVFSSISVLLTQKQILNVEYLLIQNQNDIEEKLRSVTGFSICSIDSETGYNRSTLLEIAIRTNRDLGTIVIDNYSDVGLFPQHCNMTIKEMLFGCPGRIDDGIDFEDPNWVGSGTRIMYSSNIPRRSLIAITTYNPLNDPQISNDVQLAIRSARRFSNSDILIHDDGSGEPFTTFLRELALSQNAALMISDCNEGIAASKNKCLKVFLEGNYDYCFLLDDDVEVVSAEFEERYISAMKQSGVGILSWNDPAVHRQSPESGIGINGLIATGATCGCCVVVSRQCVVMTGSLMIMPGKWGNEHGEYFVRASLCGFAGEPGMFLDIPNSGEVLQLRSHASAFSDQQKHEMLMQNRHHIEENTGSKLIASIFRAAAVKCERCGSHTTAIPLDWGWCSACEHGTLNATYEDILPVYHHVSYPAHNGDFHKLKAACQTNINLMIRFKPPGTVLDVGFLEGACMSALADAGCSVLGFDISQGACDLAVSNGIDRSKLTIAESISADLWKQKFGAIMVREVIEHVPDPRALLKELRKLLDPDGIIQIQTPVYSREARFWNMTDRLRVYSFASLKSDCSLSGLELIDDLQWPGGMCLTFRNSGSDL